MTKEKIQRQVALGSYIAAKFINVVCDDIEYDKELIKEYEKSWMRMYDYKKKRSPKKKVKRVTKKS